MKKPIDVSMFGVRLKEIRTARDWSQSELARQSGVRQNQISRFESGMRFPGVRELMLLAAALGVSADDLTAVPGERIPRVKKNSEKNA